MSAASSFRVFWGACLLSLIPFAVSASSISHAEGTTNPIKWSESTLTYYVNSAGSGDISDGTDLAAVHESFGDWGGLSCSTHAVNHVGDTGANGTILTGSPTNNKNEITWVESSAWNFGQYVLGITSPVFYTNGMIIEADIALNGYSNEWTTVNTFGGKMDVKSIALHEVGHWFGVQHNLDQNLDMWDPPTMVPGWNGTTAARTLEIDDQNAYCFLYKPGGVNCTSDDACPWVVGGGGGNEIYEGKYGCQAGSCVLGASSGGGSSGGGTSGGGTSGGGSEGSCVGKCGQFQGQGAACQCDEECASYGDCCGDYAEVCGEGSAGGGSTGGGSSGGELSCFDLLECLQSCQSQQCTSECYGQASPTALDLSGVLIGCLEGAGCFNVQTQGQWEQCVQNNCMAPYTSCANDASGGGAGGGTTGGGTTGDETTGGGTSDEETGGDATGAEETGSEETGSSADLLTCGEYLSCFSECLDEACTQGCAELVDPVEEEYAINLFICMGDNSCGIPGPNADLTCLGNFCGAEYEACYGEALSTDEQGDGGFDKDPGGSTTGIPTIGGGDSSSGGSVTIGEGSGDSGGCRTSTAPGGLAGILLFVGLFWFLRPRRRME